MVRKEAPVLATVGGSANSYFATVMFITLFVVPKSTRAVTATNRVFGTQASSVVDNLYATPVSL